MTNLLVLGGTAWLGREVARQALARGVEVTCLARGTSGAPADGVELVTADRGAPGAYDAVRERDWDAVVDVSWQPGYVRSALAALGERAAHWTYVSSCSVYADHSTPEADESAPLLPAHEGDEAGREQYGEAKVACELACQDVVADRLLVARSGLIAGYGDPSDRFGYWAARFAAAAEGHPAWAGSRAVLVPDEPDLPTQTVDVQDLARWLVQGGSDGLVGTFNAAGDRRPLSQVLEASRVASGYDGPVELVPSSWLLEQGVEEYMGPRSLPLWIVDPGWRGFSARDASEAHAAGLTSRPLADLVGDALRWERELGLDRSPRSAGLSPAEEQALLDAA
ncbi:SDR family oxidoreductase [Angustibacter peucedani]